MPSYTSINNRHSRTLQRLRQRHNFLPRTSILYQIRHAQSKDDDKVLPARVSRLPDDVERQSHSILEAAPVLIGSMIGLTDQKLIDEISLAAHDFDTVVSCLLGQCGAVGKVPYGTLDIGGGQLLCLEWRYGTARGTCGDREGMIGVSSGMENLKAYSTRLGAVGTVWRVGWYAYRMYHVCDDLVTISLGFGGEFAREGPYPSLSVWRYSSRDHQSNTALGPLRKINRHLGQINMVVFGI
mmetsp:Transcript_24219/g.51341  ORF Transcript_24219/g.51341 Transcript_24219/m.51341 type:complete len:240 (-) Transcript_24219:438-1157(-)